MPPPATPSINSSMTTLPIDADSVLKLAAQSMFETLAATAMGMLVVDRSHRIVWTSEGYKQFLPALEHEESDFVGRRVEEVDVTVALLASTAGGVTLNAGQIQLVRQMATSGCRVQVGLAAAGSGKTTALAVLAGAWRESGGTVLGLAPSAVAAGVLGEAPVAVDVICIDRSGTIVGHAR